MALHGNKVLSKEGCWDYQIEERLTISLDKKHYTRFHSALCSIYHFLVSYGATNCTALPSKSPNTKHAQETEGVDWTQFRNDYSIDSRSRIFLSLSAATVPCGGKNAFSPDAGDLVGDVSAHIGTDDIWI